MEAGIWIIQHRQSSGCLICDAASLTSAVKQVHHDEVSDDAVFVFPFDYPRGFQAPHTDTRKETSVSVPNLTVNCVPGSGVPSDRGVSNLTAYPEPSAVPLIKIFEAVARRRASGTTGATSTNANIKLNTAIPSLV